MYSTQILRNLWTPFSKFLSMLTPKMVPDHMNALLKQTLTTFTCDQEVFHQNLAILQSILDRTTAEDVGFYSKFMDVSLWETPKKAPVTYVDIYEDATVSMGIFILKSGMKLPLHNHPNMHGLLKVIAGTIKIKTYSLKSNKEESDLNITPLLSITQPVSVTAYRNEDIIADSKSNCCTLGPENNNIHEIESVGGPAAFLDILAPPYNTEIENNGPRKCVYFKVCDEVRPSTFKLEEVPPPPWFWSDCYPYTGPKLNI